MNFIEVYQGQPGTAETVLYTVPFGQRLTLTEIILCNTDPSVPRTITAHIRRGGVAAAATNRFLAGRVVEPHGTIVISLATVIAAGGILSGFISALSTITLTMSGLLEPA